jgi:hypothetical protein
LSREAFKRFLLTGLHLSRVKKELIMSNFARILYLAALLSQQVMADQAFPVAPPDASDAAATGLQRLDTSELKTAFLGKRSEQDGRGKSYVAEYGSDGSVILSNTSGLIDRGTFSVVRQNDGGVCLRLEQQMNQRMCAIWFLANDGIHLFGYNPRDGTLRAISRPAPE